MKKALENTTTLNTISEDLKMQAIIKIAEIATKSTLKFLCDNDVNFTNMLLDMRNNLNSDIRFFEKMPEIARKIELYTMYIENYDIEIAETNKAIKECIKALEKAESTKHINKLRKQLNEYRTDLESYKANRKKYVVEKTELEKCLIYSYSDSFDLFQIALESITKDFRKLENNENIIIIVYDDIDDTVNDIMQAVKGVTIETREYKTKDGTKDYDIFQNACYYVRQYINGMRNKQAQKTISLIQGYDEEGNEILVKSDKLTTTLCIDNIDNKLSFDNWYNELNLSDTDKKVIKYLLNGLTQKEIAIKLNVSAVAVNKRLTKIKKNIADDETVKNYCKVHKIAI